MLSFRKKRESYNNAYNTGFPQIWNHGNFFPVLKIGIDVKIPIFPYIIYYI